MIKNKTSTARHNQVDYEEELTDRNNAFVRFRLRPCGRNLKFGG